MDSSSHFSLHFQGAAGAWEDRPLPDGVHVIGRAPECEISLPGNDISRRHAQLEITPTGCWLMDLGSANGTLLNGAPLPPRRRTPIAAGQSFQIMERSFSLQQLAGAVPQVTGRRAPLESSECTPLEAASLPRLRWRHGGEAWQEYTLAPGDQFIGREPGNQIRLDSSAVSRRHARLTLINNELTLTDLNSRNGVTAQGRRLPADQAVPLAVGGSFTIEDFTFEVLAPAQPAGSLAPISPESGTVRLSDRAVSAALPVATGSLNLSGHDRVSIGRAPDNQLILNHPLVSRYHAVIERMGTRSRLTNLHSANGVFLNGQQINQQSWLAPGDTIKIGPYVLTFTGNELCRSTAESFSIDAIGLNKWVAKNVNLLKDISLNIGQNEFVALVGMSGAGKSTLMDAVNGFRPATQGRVLVNGVDLYANYNMFRDDIGNVPQRDIVHMELTPEQALTYAARLRMPAETSEEERQAAVKETLEELGLTAKKDVPIARLSGGQLKRVSIGVELLTRPRLFFLDEPTSGLDPGTEYEMMKLLRKLADQGRTIIIITHATKNVMFCDKAIILAKGGNLAFYGPPEHALEYFDQYRTHREQLEKDMEFDDIYRVLQDESRGKPEDWRERYLKSEYAHYAQPKNQQPAPATPAKSANRRKSRISGLRQFFILSSRNLKCMLQDRASLGLTLALAPVLGLMNFIWGPNLFDPVLGDAAKVMSIWYICTIIGLLVGAMGSVREIVKENDIYKRERAVGLQVLPYILSKTWIGVVLAIYQGFVLLLFVVILNRPVVSGPPAYVSLLITMILGVICGYLLGLLISALAPNQNSAQIILIAAIVPQFLFSGVLQPLDRIPGGEMISNVITSRWMFESFVKGSGMGDTLISDSCWNLPSEQRTALTSSQKEQCKCLGPNLFVNCGKFPGVLSPDYYDDAARVALAEGEPNKPQQPTRLPSPTPHFTPTTIPTPTMLPTPTFLPTPTPYPTPPMLPLYVGGINMVMVTQNPAAAATQAAGIIYGRVMAYKHDSEVQLDNYRKTREAQFQEYRDQTDGQIEDYTGLIKGQFQEYQDLARQQVADHIALESDAMTAYGDSVQGQFEGYADAMKTYGDTLSDWERHRQEAIGAAETVLGMIYDNYGRAFYGTVTTRWLYLGIICVVQFVLILVFQKRKDSV